MTNKEFVLDCLIEDDEAFTQIVEYFELVAEVDVSPLEIEILLEEMLAEGYVSINYDWKNEHNEFPYSLTQKGRDAWEKITDEDIFNSTDWCLSLLMKTIKVNIIDEKSIEELVKEMLNELIN